MPNYQGLMQMVGQQQSQRQDQPISKFTQDQISNSMNEIRAQQGLPPASTLENFNIYIGMDPDTQQLINQHMQNSYIQNLPGTGI